VVRRRRLRSRGTLLGEPGAAVLAVGHRPGDIVEQSSSDNSWTAWAYAPPASFAYELRADLPAPPRSRVIGFERPPVRFVVLDN